MKLAHVDMERVIELDCRKAVEWIIESPAFFQRYVQLLNYQAEGGDGEFVLSDGDVILDISKCAEVIMNPFTLDFEDRRIQKKLYTGLQKTAYGEEMFLETQKITAALQGYIFQLENVCGYDIEIDTAVDIQVLFKALGVRLEGGEYNFSKKIAQYMKINTGQYAQLEVGNNQEYILPFIGELKNILLDYQDELEKVPALKDTLDQFMFEKEEMSDYPWIELLWDNDIKTRSIHVKFIFNYMNKDYGLIQHYYNNVLVGMERMNYVVDYIASNRTDPSETTE